MTKLYYFRMILLTALFLTACQPSLSITTSEKEVAASQDSQATDTLTICLGYEPDSLYPYALSSQAARDVLQAIYDDPIDIIDGQAQPVILEAIPVISSTPVDVRAGDQVMDIYGQLIALQAGAQVFPAGCASADCAIQWDGSSPLQMEHPSAIFRLLPSLTWSDGEPLSASDSLYSFRLASDTATPNDKRRVWESAAYNVLDESSVEWQGRPGLVAESAAPYFWMPLPEHAWGDLSAQELLTAEASSRMPLGWGPYVLQEWRPGESIRLVKNLNYFRAGEALPKYDYLVFRVTNRFGDTNLANLKFDRQPFAQFDYDLGDFQSEIDRHGCDLVSSTADMSDQLNVLNTLMNYFKDPAVKVFDGSQKNATWLLFNQADEGLFADIRLRQAAAACLERAALADKIFHNLVRIPSTFSFSYNSGLAAENAAIHYDPEVARRLLEESGWRAENSQGEKPRRAYGITGVEDGSPLSVNYMVQNDALSLAVANQVKQSLAQCGFQVNILAAAPQDFWNAAALDSIFNGNFHLAQLDWGLPIQNPCVLFASPSAGSDNQAHGSLNLISYANARVDAICGELDIERRQSARQKLLQEMESTLHQELALLPLFEKADWMVARNDFCAIQTSSDQSELAFIEDFEYSPACAP